LTNDDACPYILATVRLLNAIQTTARRLLQIESALEGAHQVLIVPHTNPDPDGIVSALFLKELLVKRFGISSTVAFAGVIGRAENNELLHYSRAPVERLSRIDEAAFDTIALVDTQPGTGNDPFGHDPKIRMVFDHHRMRPRTRSVAFHDVQTAVGATSTLLYLYRAAAALPLSRRHATMLLYALRSETSDLGREASALDRDVFGEVYPAADLKALSGIARAKVGRGFFSMIHSGIEQAVIYGPLAVTKVDRLAYPDVVAELAEYFLKYKKVRYSFAIGRFDRRILFSIRADDPSAHLGVLAQRIVKNLGTAGGHGAAAGGQINAVTADGAEIDVGATMETIVKRLLKALHVSKRHPRKLLRPSSGARGL
jgi:nanoRNase/pAp phosphatase (c-di-AMP/oligoRNAs hydrolase)